MRIIKNTQVNRKTDSLIFSPHSLIAIVKRGAHKQHDAQRGDAAGSYKAHAAHLAFKTGNTSGRSVRARMFVRNLIARGTHSTPTYSPRSSYALFGQSANLHAIL